MKLIAIALALVFAATSSIAVAGVTPNSAASAAAQSGAKVAAPKSNTPTQTSGDAASETSTTK